ncbi:hypothetical protein [Myceligenerans indicum]|uniref:DUF4232 domain-containing protein n=1 Tax=Myceligenerans indicum TaxID=2593663 RepID=A0ABS1LKR4_9MICO|nr:hypothetical protein [Myceligenerans indicum]MBL0886850.1 hypothetical protein [Myceligenerans indicum]
MQARESGAFGRRRVVVVLLVAVLVLIGVAVVPTMWPEPPAPIESDAKVHPPAPADPGSATRTCGADVLDVRLAADRSTAAEGQPVVFTVTLENSGATPCLVDGADANRPVTVWAGEPGDDAERVWSSGDCDDEERMLLLGPGSVDTKKVRWSDVRSAPGCERVDKEIAPGLYSAQVTVADVAGAASQVVQVTRPEPPEPSPSPSRGKGGKGGATDKPAKPEKKPDKPSETPAATSSPPPSSAAGAAGDQT